MKNPVRGISDNRVLTSQQKGFLQEFVKTELRNIFRLTGGTALSAFYLEHRLSEDLDFFSSEKIPFYLVEEFLKGFEFIGDITYTKLFDRNIFNLSLKNTGTIKVEFTYYPLKNLEDVFLIDNLQVDSLLDIIVNKLCAIADRFDAKDYVDLYTSLKEGNFSLKELMDLANKKCEIRGIGHILKSRLLEIPEGIENIPMRVSVTKAEIKNLFEGFIRDIVKGEIGR